MPTGNYPIFRIERGGTDITNNFNDRALIIEIKLQSGNGGQDTFEITLDDRDSAIESPAVGAKLAIYLGYHEVGLAYMGTFEVSEVEYEGPPDTIKLTGLSAGMSNDLKSQEFQQYDNTTLGDVIRKLAQKGGVEAMIDPSLEGLKIPFLNQNNISGYHLLQDLERRFDGIAKFSDGRLTFMKRDDGESGLTGVSTLVVFRRWHLNKWRVKHKERSDYSEVQARWWDKDKHQTTWESATKDSSVANEGDTPYRLRQPFNSQAEAKQAAQARLAQLNRDTGEVWLELAKGDPWVRDQMHCQITDMRPGVNGSYVIDDVTHTFVKDQGIGTVLNAKPPGDATESYADQLQDTPSVSPLEGDKIAA